MCTRWPVWLQDPHWRELLRHCAARGAYLGAGATQMADLVRQAGPAAAAGLLSAVTAVDSQAWPACPLLPCTLWSPVAPQTSWAAGAGQSPLPPALHSLNPSRQCLLLHPAIMLQPHRLCCLSAGRTGLQEVLEGDISRDRSPEPQHQLARHPVLMPAVRAAEGRGCAREDCASHGPPGPAGAGQRAHTVPRCRQPGRAVCQRRRGAGLQGHAVSIQSDINFGARRHVHNGRQHSNTVALLRNCKRGAESRHPAWPRTGGSEPWPLPLLHSRQWNRQRAPVPASANIGRPACTQQANPHVRVGLLAWVDF